MREEVILKRIVHIEQLVDSLLKAYSASEEENDRLRQEITELKKQINHNEQDLQNFKNQEKISKIASGVTVGEQSGNTELKHKVNEYIREIDKCIAHLRDEK